MQILNRNLVKYSVTLEIFILTCLLQQIEYLNKKIFNQFHTGVGKTT